METPGFNFINILRAAFWFQSVLRNFSVLTTVWVWVLWQKEIGKKAGHKMLVKLNTVRRNGHLGQADPDRVPLLQGVGPSFQN